MSHEWQQLHNKGVSKMNRFLVTKGDSVYEVLIDLNEVLARLSEEDRVVLAEKALVLEIQRQARKDVSIIDRLGGSYKKVDSKRSNSSILGKAENV